MINNSRPRRPQPISVHQQDDGFDLVVPLLVCMVMFGGIASSTADVSDSAAPVPVRGAVVVSKTLAGEYPRVVIRYDDDGSSKTILVGRSNYASAIVGEPWGGHR